MVELPKTEEELTALIEQRVNEATEKLVSKHNGEMASLRTSYEKKLKEASMSAEDLAQTRAKELAEAQQNELNDLRAFKRATLIKDRVTKAGLPEYFVNDTRLLNAEEGDLDKVIKTVKADYDASLPKGNTHSSVVTTSGGKPPVSDTQQVYQDAGNAIKNALG